MKVIPIIPRKNPIPWETIVKAGENALTATAKAIQSDFGVTVQTWSNPSSFTIDKPRAFERHIYTTDPIYGYVNYGTRPHKIRPKNASVLAFPANYSAKTTPYKISSKSGGSSGPTVFSTEVNHPGTQGRFFTRVIGKKWQKQWPIQLQRAFSAALS